MAWCAGKRENEAEVLSSYYCYWWWLYFHFNPLLSVLFVLFCKIESLSLQHLSLSREKLRKIVVSKQTKDSQTVCSEKLSIWEFSPANKTDFLFIHRARNNVVWFMTFLSERSAEQSTEKHLWIVGNHNICKSFMMLRMKRCFEFSIPTWMNGMEVTT